MFLFIHNHLTLRKWCYTPLQHDFALDPIIPPFDLIDINRLLYSAIYNME